MNLWKEIKTNLHFHISETEAAKSKRHGPKLKEGRALMFTDRLQQQQQQHIHASIIYILELQYAELGGNFTVLQSPLPSPLAPSPLA